MTAPVSRRQAVLKGIRVFRWEDASALQNLGAFDWVALVPFQYAERPDFIPPHAERRPLKDGEVAFIWSRGLL